jgi:hypothetical protein
MKVYAVQWKPTGEIVQIETSKHQAHNYRRYDGNEIMKDYEVVAYDLVPISEETN